MTALQTLSTCEGFSLMLERMMSKPPRCQQCEVSQCKSQMLCVKVRDGRRKGPETARQRSAASTPATLSPACWDLMEVCPADAVAAL